LKFSNQINLFGNVVIYFPDSVLNLWNKVKKRLKISTDNQQEKDKKNKYIKYAHSKADVFSFSNIFLWGKTFIIKMLVKANSNDTKVSIF
jgi:hypothetical protein